MRPIAREEDDMGTPDGSGTYRSRRAVLGGAVAAVGAMAVGAVRPPTVLGADVVLGGWNLADHLTEILIASGDVLKCTTTGAGNTAIYGLADSEGSHGVYGTST